MYSGIIRNYDIQNGRLRLWINFYKDGVILETGREGNYSYRYIEHDEYKGLTKEQFKQKINDYVKSICEFILAEEYQKQNGYFQVSLAAEKANLVKAEVDTFRDEIVGMEVSTDQAIVKIATNFKDVPDKQVTIKADNTVVIEDI